MLLAMPHAPDPLRLPARARVTPQRRAGSVRPLPGTGRPTYVRCHSGHHHHLICLTCGSVEETEICAAPAPAELKRRYGFSESSHEVDIYGTCARCAA